MWKIIRLIVLQCLFVGCLFSLSAQISHGGKPRSFQKSNLLQPVAVEKLPYLDNELLLQQEMVSSKKTGYQFGEEVAVDYTLDNSGTWDTLADGSRLWRLGIYSAGAYSLNLLFDSFHIPSSSNLFIYTGNKSYVMGSFTSENNNQWGNFATSLLPGDEIILEYYESAADKGLGIISLSTVVHAYKDFFFKRGTFGSSGACHVNINCQEGDNFQEAKRAVALILRGGRAYCSGTLMNNTAQDGKPYFLTAFHCLDVDDNKIISPAEESGLSGWVFIFNYESSDCGGQNEKPTYAINGATLVAHHIHSDFALLLLNNKPTQEYNPYYAGWDRRNIAIIGATGIHHPSGDLKKISKSNKLLDSSNWYDFEDTFPKNTHWKVMSWSLGATEGGSSGSALFNPLQQVIGQLEGGNSLCNGSQPNNLEDYYGKISYSWTSGNAANFKRLDYWLDPLSLGTEVLNGYDPYENIPGIRDRFIPKDNISIFPNPANNIVTIETDEDIIACALYSVNGQCLEEYATSSNTVEITVQSFPTGIYLLKIQTAKGLTFKKLIIQK